MEKKTKAIGLFSGGLDSILAVKLMLEQGIEVEAVNYTTVFCGVNCGMGACRNAYDAAASLRASLKVVDVSEEFLDVIKRPKYGYGSAINPCIDCRIFMLRKAKSYMEERGASFVFTGEVIGQRPMSQRREVMNIIERDSGLKGLLVRPLCAKLFSPSVAEQSGLLDRGRLFSMSGRSRRPQQALAERLGIKNYPSSGGGCLLTVKDFGKRVRDLLAHKPDFDLEDIILLKYGRHFRMSPAIKLVVGRNETENCKIAALRKADDIMFHAQEPLGPVCLMRGDSDGKFLSAAASIAARYALGMSKEGEVKIKYTGNDGGRSGYLKTGPYEEAELNLWRI